jgi:hypothetical protein
MVARLPIVPRMERRVAGSSTSPPARSFVRSAQLPRSLLSVRRPVPAPGQAVDEIMETK